MKNNKKKLSLPVLMAIIFTSLDLGLWIWFFAIYLMHSGEIFYEEGLFLMTIMQMPISFFAVLLGYPLAFLLSGIMPIAVARTIILMSLGLAQYFLFGYLFGKIVNYIRKKTGHNINERLVEIKADSCLGKIKFWTINILYFVFTFLFFSVLIPTIKEMMADFEFYNMNYPLVRHLINGIMVVIWMIGTIAIYRFDKIFIKERKGIAKKL